LRQFFALAAVLALGGCGSKGVEGVTEAQVSLPAVPGQPGAAYFTLTGGEKENRLMQVSSPQALKIELHESMAKGGMMSMTPIEGGVAVPAGGSVKFKPGGKHAMMFDINPAAKAGGTMKLSFTYSDGRVIEADAAVKAAGDVTEHSH
jgi:periplasmic copper chaperone A